MPCMSRNLKIKCFLNNSNTCFCMKIKQDFLYPSLLFFSVNGCEVERDFQWKWNEKSSVKYLLKTCWGKSMNEFESLKITIFLS